MADLYVSLGSNLGDRLDALNRARTAIGAEPGYTIDDASAVYETAPLGGPPQKSFLNQAVRCTTQEEPRAVLRTLKRIEKALGRKKSSRWGPRRIDIDIVFYDDCVCEDSELQIPHPRMHERLFVLIPLSEIAPSVIHPEYKKSVSELRDQLQAAAADKQMVRRYSRGKA